MQLAARQAEEGRECMGRYRRTEDPHRFKRRARIMPDFDCTPVPAYTYSLSRTMHL